MNLHIFPRLHIDNQYICRFQLALFQEISSFYPYVFVSPSAQHQRRPAAYVRLRGNIAPEYASCVAYFQRFKFLHFMLKKQDEESKTLRENAAPLLWCHEKTAALERGDKHLKLYPHLELRPLAVTSGDWTQNCLACMAQSRAMGACSYSPSTLLPTCLCRQQASPSTAPMMISLMSD